MTHISLFILFFYWHQYIRLFRQSHSIFDLNYVASIMFEAIQIISIASSLVIVLLLRTSQALNPSAVEQFSLFMPNVRPYRVSKSEIFFIMRTNGFFFFERYLTASKPFQQMQCVNQLHVLTDATLVFFCCCLLLKMKKFRIYWIQIVSTRERHQNNP